MRKAQVSDRRSLARLAGPPDAAVPPAGRQRWPAPLSSFVGREAELAELTTAMAEHRLVTVTGPGGIGKTRLALHGARQVASARLDDGWFVDLVEVTDPQMVMPVVAAAVGVAEPHRQSLDDALTVMPSSCWTTASTRSTRCVHARSGSWCHARR
jgi:hypothetical protein